MKKTLRKYLLVAALCSGFMGALAGTGQAAEKMTAADMKGVSGAQLGMVCSTAQPGCFSHLAYPETDCKRTVGFPKPECITGAACDECVTNETLHLVCQVYTYSFDANGDCVNEDVLPKQTFVNGCSS
jgi:hypothetical protein